MTRFVPRLFFSIMSMLVYTACNQTCHPDGSHAASIDTDIDIDTDTDEAREAHRDADVSVTQDAQQLATESTEEATTTTTEASAEPTASFLGEPDKERRRSLQHADIAHIQRGRGGRSLAFKITLEDGTVGYFKPEQEFSAAHWYSEVAAYYLDRALGLGRTPPTVGRTLPWPPLRRAARGDKRIPEVRVRQREVRGAFIWWIPEDLKRLSLGRGWEKWIRHTGGLGITPYQRPRDYRRALRHGPDPDPDPTRGAENPRRALASDSPSQERVAELSDLILFDYLTQNVDRWGGGFTNVRTRGKDGPLIFLDNGAGFWLGEQQLGLMKTRLRILQKFRSATVKALRNFDIHAFRAAMAQDPLAPVLNETQLAGLQTRIQAALAHIAAMERQFGERIFL